MARQSPKVEVFHIDRNNPDQTGWDYPGLQYAARLGVPAYLDPQGLKRVFYKIYKLHAFPFRHLRKLGGQIPLQFARPGELHRDEGSKAHIFAFVSFLCHVKHSDPLFWKTSNIHVYTADNDEEIPLDASLDEILAGKYGTMDQNNPLRVVWIPGKRGKDEQPFPHLSWICGGRKKGVIHLPPSEIPYDSPGEMQNVSYFPPSDSDNIGDAPPSYEEVWGAP